MTTRRRLTARFWTGLLLVGVGAYLAFAVSFHATAFDPRTVGYLLIMAGVLAMAIPRRGSDRVRRSMLMRHYQQNTRQSYPRDLLLAVPGVVKLTIDFAVSLAERRPGPLVIASAPLATVVVQTCRPTPRDLGGRRSRPEPVFHLPLGWPVNLDKGGSP